MIGLDIPKGIIGIDLFSGIGGISYALEGFVTPVCYCEIDPYCQSVLLQRMQAGDLPKAPIWDDVCTLPFEELPPIDIIYGGFPCTNISIAGRGEGLAGKQSGLFFEIVRLAKEIKPKFLFLENVPAITSRGGLQVVREITEMGYDCRWCVISAASVGALHRRERWFLLAHSNYDGAFAGQGGGSPGERIVSGQRQEEQEEGFRQTERTSDVSFDVSNAASERFEETNCITEPIPSGQPRTCGEGNVSNAESEGPHGFGGIAERSEKEQSEPSLCGKNSISHTDNKRNDSSIRDKKEPSNSLGNSCNECCDTDGISSRQANTRPESFDNERQAWGDDPGFRGAFESRDDWKKTVCEMGKCVDGISAKLVFNTQQLKALGNSVVPMQVRKAFKILMGLAV